MHAIKRCALGKCTIDRRHFAQNRWLSKRTQTYNSKLFAVWSVLTGPTKCMRTRRMFVCNINGIVFSCTGRYARYALNPNESTSTEWGGVWRLYGNCSNMLAPTLEGLKWAAKSQRIDDDGDGDDDDSGMPIFDIVYRKFISGIYPPVLVPLQRCACIRGVGACG